MNKPTQILLALCVGAPLMAQAPSLTFYGILDTGIAHVTRTQSFDDNFVVGTNPFPQKVRTSATGQFNGGLAQTRIGVKGSADLMDGWSAIFTLESAINLGSGVFSDAGKSLAQSGGQSTAANSAIDGQVFSRGAFVGVSHKTYGTLTFGRQNNLLNDGIMGTFDAMGQAQLFTPFGFSGQYAGGGITEDTRINNTLKYRVKIADVTVAVLYKLAGTAGPSVQASSAAREITVDYQAGPFGIFGGYETYTNGVTLSAAPAAFAGMVNATVVDTKALDLGAYFIVGPVKITAGYQNLKSQDPSVGDAAYYLGLNNPTGAGTPSTQFLFSERINAFSVNSIGAGKTKEIALLYAGAAWDVTSKLKLAASYYQAKQNDYRIAEAAGTAKDSGTTGYTSLLADYSITKAFDAYAAYMGSKMSGNNAGTASGVIAADGTNFSKNAVYAVGVRYKF